MNRQNIGKGLKEELLKGYDIVRISRWSFQIFSNEKSLNQETRDILEELFSMENDPQFELSQEELTQLANKLSEEVSMQKDIYILELVDSKITRYFNKSVYISDLIYDLESYLNQLTTVDDQWKKDFRTIWLDIEVAYSLALNQGLENLTEEGTVLAENSLHNLKKMARDKINDLRAHENE